MRAYTVAAVAVTLKVPAKWIDNVLSHHSVHGVIQARQGVTRRLSPQAVTILAIALQLVRSASLPLSRALDIAQRAVQAGTPEARVQLSPSVGLVVDTSAIRTETSARLAEAVEIAPRPRRGRPPG
ncbi:MAG: hypothetical protein ABI556_02320 [Gemmatimonadales bacterium]